MPGRLIDPWHERQPASAILMLLGSFCATCETDHTRGASAVFNSRAVMHGKARELTPGTRHPRHDARLGRPRICLLPGLWVWEPRATVPF
jgi:hypothetical protein